MNRLSALIFLFLFSVMGFAQEPERRELDFVQYLISRNELQESLFLLEKMETNRQALTDSVNYFKGWILYQQKQLEPSANLFLKVSPESSFYKKSQFFASYNFAHSGKPEIAAQILQDLFLEKDSVLTALKNFQLGGVALLQRDFEGFSARAVNFRGQYNAFAQQEVNLVNYAGQLSGMPRRSPVVAGLLSAAVPGLGKIYAGKTAEGVAGFLYLGAMGLTTYDFYRRLGPKNAFFILSSAVTGIFYFGNIWGSAVAVRRQQNEFNYEMDQRILFDLHIPLRNFFQ